MTAADNKLKLTAMITVAVPERDDLMTAIQYFTCIFK
jgi:hypothetical protein